MSLYEITLKNCSFFAHHGVMKEEERLGQRFFIDAVIEANAPKALESDQIEDALNYASAFEIVEKIVTKTRCRLIEKLAMDIAIALCKEFKQIESVEVAVRKPSAAIPGVLDYVEAKITHSPKEKRK